jgi:orotidine-5'-phosphate decarboxylase
MKRNFRDMLEAQWARGKMVCVGLDPDIRKIPEHLQMKFRMRSPIIKHFCHEIIEATKDLVCAYKPNSAFFVGLGGHGEETLSYVIATIKELPPDVPIILDAKRGDIDNTNTGYIESAFTWLNADAITVHPYLGREALQPFLDQKDKGIIVLCRTTNSGAREFQDLQVVINPETDETTSLYRIVAKHVAKKWNTNGNCAIVAGATYPEELRDVRRIVGDMPILIPGIGAQGGDIEKTVIAGKDSRGRGMIINSSRGIIFASNGEDFAEAARRETLKLHSEIAKYC